METKTTTIFLSKSEAGMLRCDIHIGLCSDGTPYIELTEQELSYVMYHLSQLQTKCQKAGRNRFGWR